MTDVYYDTEFLEDGSTIGLISIGMVTDDGREYYAVRDNPWTIRKAIQHEWLRANVVPSLPIRLTATGAGWEWYNNHPDRAAVRTRVAGLTGG
jgi:3' exoribonuclease, RNase T-like